MQIENHSNDRATDPIDIACEQEQRERESHLNAAKARCIRDQLPLPDGTYAITECDECGNEIGEARLRVAIRNCLCIDCATADEKRRARMSR
jgi:RNA polymerase-binding transcription factor DksA